jgi:peptidoglycan hydrolase-like protein with peptidoglycan-binding domain
MRIALVAGVSVVALALGGCSWMEAHNPLSSNTDTAQNSSAQAPAESGSSQAPAASASTSPATTDQAGTTTSSPASTSHHTMAKSRMNGDELKQAQQKLKDDGDYQGNVDGKMGPKTAQAVKSYQQKNGLKQTGRLDHATLAKLGVGGSSTNGSGSSASDSKSAVPPETPNPPASQTPAH